MLLTLQNQPFPGNAHSKTIASDDCGSAVWCPTDPNLFCVSSINCVFLVRIAVREQGKHDGTDANGKKVFSKDTHKNPVTISQDATF